MAAHRKHPPANALEEIERLANKGHSTIGLAKYFNVARSTLKRWLEEDERFEDAYEKGRDSYRQAIEEQIVSMSLAGKNCAGLIFLMKAKFGFYDVPQSGTKIDVAVNNQPVPVLIVTDHGTDAQWSAKCEEQQRRLTAPDSQTIPASLPAPQNASETSAEPVSDTLPIPAPVALPAPSYAPAWRPRS